MIKPQIAVIANRLDYAWYMKENLDIYLSGYARINCYDTDHVRQMEHLTEECIFLSAFTIFQQVKEKTTPEASLFIADLTLNKKGLESLNTLPQGTRALLVNIDYRSCMEVITMIYSAGYKELELIPFYPGMSWDETVKVAITPGEERLAPKGVATVLDIGQRVIDTSCVLALAEHLQVENPFSSPAAVQARANSLPSSAGLEKVFAEKDSLSSQMETLIQVVNQGILIIDLKGKICLHNQLAFNILRQRTPVLKGFSVDEILPEAKALEPGEGVGSSYGGNPDRGGELISISGADYIVSVRPILNQDQVRGKIVTLDNFADAERRQHRMRKKRAGYSHAAAYTFDSILGSSEAIRETKKIAMRMAGSVASVVLYGESGTGKELFAQSLHNHSPRRDKNFVAVNCSALPEHLLESELYGYEEGAFSGARKGGKTGLFELAHQGTIFLDEIGEIPLSLQAKLLRVLEEKKILRVGGMELIDIDVRVVSATNQNLKEMVREKRFRSDLYYRLNVLPVHIPSLRERPEDIPLLLGDFFQTAGKNFRLTEEAWLRIRRHRWPGNVRELKNVAEYLINLDKGLVEEQDLPLDQEETPGSAVLWPDMPGSSLTEEEEGWLTQFMRKERDRLTVDLFVLEQLQMSYEQRIHIGRNQLAARAAENGLFITEQEIKNALARLNAWGLVQSGRGRKGTVIAPLGQRLLIRVNGRK